jgi:hypothetical protein
MKHKCGLDAFEEKIKQLSEDFKSGESFYYLKVKAVIVDDSLLQFKFMRMLWPKE